MKSLSPQRLLKRFWRSVLALALVPVIFFAGLPQVGCICADGHFEQNCPILKQARAAARHETKGNATCCGCVGCTNSADRGSKSCRQSGCKIPVRSDDGQTSVNANTGCCCTPAVHVPDAPVKAKEVEGLSAPTVQPAMLAELLAPPSINNAFANESWVDPPVTDLVIVLQRLTI